MICTFSSVWLGVGDDTAFKQDDEVVLDDVVCIVSPSSAHSRSTSLSLPSRVGMVSKLRESGIYFSVNIVYVVKFVAARFLMDIGATSSISATASLATGGGAPMAMLYGMMDEFLLCFVCCGRLVCYRCAMVDGGFNRINQVPPLVVDGCWRDVDVAL